MKYDIGGIYINNLFLNNIYKDILRIMFIVFLSLFKGMLLSIVLIVLLFLLFIFISFIFIFFFVYIYIIKLF